MYTRICEELQMYLVVAVGSRNWKFHTNKLPKQGSRTLMAEELWTSDYSSLVGLDERLTVFYSEDVDGAPFINTVRTYYQRLTSVVYTSHASSMW